MTGTGVILVVLSLLGIAIAAQLSIGGRQRVLYTTAFLFSAGFWPTLVSTQSIPAGLKEPGLLREEIRRHVIDECDLYSLYKKNRNEFDPIEVGVNILPEIFKTKRSRDQIHHEPDLPGGQKPRFVLQESPNLQHLL